MEIIYLIKKELSIKNKFIIYLILSVTNIITNLILNLKPYYLWFFVIYVVIKLLVFTNICKYFNEKLKVFNDMLLVINYEIHSLKKFKLIFKIEIPFETIDKNKLEHCLNASIVSFELVEGKKNVVIGVFQKGKISEYYKLEKGSLERLESIVELMRGKPLYVNSFENEVEKVIELISIISPKKMLRETDHIEHKLGLKKGYLTIDHNNGVYSFKIKKDNNRIYLLDDYIGGVKKPANMQLPFILGVNYSTGSIVIKDLIDVLHLLIAGKTGSGKSITFHSIIQSLMYWNQNIAFYMLDFAEVELVKYETFKNVKYVENDFESVKNSITELREELDNRKTLFRNNNVVNIKEYNSLCPDQAIPYIVFCIDEANGFKEDFENKEFEEIVRPIKALLKRGRKYGIILLFGVQQTNDTDFVKSWKTQLTRLGHLLVDHIDCNNLTTNKEIAAKLPNLGRGEFYLIQEGRDNIPKMKGLFSKKDDQLYKVLKEVYCEKLNKKPIEIKEKGENANNNPKNANDKNTCIN